MQERITKSSDDELPAVLDSISEWCWPRGDLYYWTGTLNRFDTILENVCRDYELSAIQVNDFTPLTKRLVVSFLRFSRLLIENCTNRKLYSSFEHLNEFLYARDLDVLEAALAWCFEPLSSTTAAIPDTSSQVSKDRLTTLAMIWTPRDHGLSLVDIARPGRSNAIGSRARPLPVLPTQRINSHAECIDLFTACCILIHSANQRLASCRRSTASLSDRNSSSNSSTPPRHRHAHATGTAVQPCFPLFRPPHFLQHRRAPTTERKQRSSKRAKQLHSGRRSSRRSDYCRAQQGHGRSC